LLQSQFSTFRNAARGDPFPTLLQRKQWLSSLQRMLDAHAQDFTRAISEDFGHRSAAETWIADIMPLRSALRHTQRHLARWMRTQKVPTNWKFKPGRSVIVAQPLGVVGVISPWNYPLYLALAPAVDALAAGNRVMIKPSELTPRFSELLAELVAQYFAADTLRVVLGGVDVGRAFSELPWDHLFFTGSTQVGASIAKVAAANLTPTTLELGGKSPTIISQSANLERALGSVVMGKALNAGQTCIAPDYLYVHIRHREQFVKSFERALYAQYPDLNNTRDYTALISAAHFDRQLALLDDARAQGAQVIAPQWANALPDRQRRRLAPTLVLETSSTMRVMQEEIFGPVLPVLFYSQIEDVIKEIGARPRPLALYWFGNDVREQQRILQQTIAGGVTINDCLLHIAQENLPFGGIGPSGHGSYHAEWGFRNFSKLKPVFEQSRWSGSHLLRAPYGRLFEWMAKAMGRRHSLAKKDL
jgi:coniferyl-aldehyde dehydrogenase